MFLLHFLAPPTRITLLQCLYQTRKAVSAMPCVCVCVSDRQKSCVCVRQTDIVCVCAHWVKRDPYGGREGVCKRASQPAQSFVLKNGVF